MRRENSACIRGIRKEEVKNKKQRRSEQAGWWQFGGKIGGEGLEVATHGVFETCAALQVAVEGV